MNMELSNEQKQNSLINYFGSVKAYNEEALKRMPAMFFMYIDQDGQYKTDPDSLTEYLNQELSKGLTYEKIKERDTKLFTDIVSQMYTELINFKSN